MSDREPSPSPLAKADVWAIALSAPTFILALHYVLSYTGRIAPMSRMLAELKCEMSPVTIIVLAMGDSGIVAFFAITTIVHAVLLFVRVPPGVRLWSAIAYFVLTAAFAGILTRGLMQPMIDIQRALAE